MKKRFLALALGTLAFGVTLGGVKMGLGHQDALMVKAAEETKFETLSFPDKNNSENSQSAGYSKTWTAISENGVKYAVSNFNNNGWRNNWKFIKCGSKKGASTGSISTIGSMDKAVCKVSFNVDAIKEPKAIKSISLLVANNDKFNDPKTYSLSSAAIVGENYFSLPSPDVNLYYRLQFDCNKTNDNGAITVKSVSFYTDKETPAEPSSPVKSISAGLKNPDAVFYAGNKVTLGDFVITATRGDGKVEELTSGVVLKNDTLVEGANTIEFEYIENGKTFTCTCQVPAIAKPLYTKSTNVADIVAGKRILITNSDGTKAMGTQKTNNRSYVAAAPSEDKIALADGMASLLVVPAKNGTFALCDETANGLLYASSDSANQLKTMTRFSSIDENAFATIGCVDSIWSIQFTGSNSHNTLRYNPNNGSPIFACYTPDKEDTEDVSVYVSSETPVTFSTDAWADSFIANVSSKCDATGATATWTDGWNTAKESFNKLTMANKMALLYGSNSEKVNQAIATYKFIVDKYNTVDDYLGLGTGKTTKANALMLPGATDSTTWTLVGIGAVTIAASASLLFFRRKKSN